MIQFKFYSLGRIKLILSRLIKIHDYANCIITNEYFYFIIKDKNIIKLEITILKGIINDNGITGTLNILQMYKSIKCIPAILDCVVEWNKDNYLYLNAFNNKDKLKYESKTKVLQSDISLDLLKSYDIINTSIYANKYCKICLKSILWILEKFILINDNINLSFENDKLILSTKLDDISGNSEIKINNKNNIDESFTNIKINNLIHIFTNLETFSDYAYVFINNSTLELSCYSYLDSNIMISTL